MAEMFGRARNSDRATDAGERAGLRQVCLPRLVILTLLVDLALGACSSGGGLASGGALSPSLARPGPTAGGARTAGPAPSGPVAAQDDGLALVVSLSRSEVPSGGDITLDVTVRNDRSTPVTIGPGNCGALVTMYAELPVPLDPRGKTWTGIEGEFKNYALAHGYREGGLPMSHPGWVYADAGRCDQPPVDRTLEPGGTLTASMTWTAQLVPGVPALPGVVPFTVSLAHDPTGGPPSYPPDYHGVRGLWFFLYRQLTVSGTIDIVGDRPVVVSAGQAIDAMLDDPRFATWLTQKPAATWSIANVFLQNAGEAQGIVPAGPSWDVELFREAGVPRNWAIGFVDAASGRVLSVTFCNEPCSR